MIFFLCFCCRFLCCFVGVFVCLGFFFLVCGFFSFFGLFVGCFFQSCCVFCRSFLAPRSGLRWARGWHTDFYAGTALFQDCAPSCVLELAEPFSGNSDDATIPNLSGFCAFPFSLKIKLMLVPWLTLEHRLQVLCSRRSCLPVFVNSSLCAQTLWEPCLLNPWRAEIPWN